MSASSPASHSTRRLLASAVIALFTLVGAACGGSEPTATGIDAVLVDEADTDTSNQSDQPVDANDTDGADAGTEPAPETVPPADESAVVDPEPQPDDQQQQQPEGQEPDEQTETYCAAYNATDKAGSGNPETAAEGEQMIATMLTEMDIVVDNAPEHIAESAKETRRFIKEVAKGAISSDWDPAYFEELTDTDFDAMGVDEDLIISFFTQSEELCLRDAFPPIEPEVDEAPAPDVDAELRAED